MTKIENANQLCVEISSLKIVAKKQEGQLKNDLKEISDDKINAQTEYSLG